MLGLDVGCLISGVLFVASLIGLEALWSLMQIFGVQCLKLCLIEKILNKKKRYDVNQLNNFR